MLHGVAERMPTERQVWALAAQLGVALHVTKGKLNESKEAAMRVLLYWRNTVPTPQEEFRVLRSALQKLKQHRIVREVLEEPQDP